MRIHHKIACFDYDCLALSLLSTRKLKAARFLVSSRLKGSISRAACRLTDCALPFCFSIFILRRYRFVVNLTNFHHNFPAKKFWPAHGSDNCPSQRLRPFREKPSAKCSLKKTKNKQCSASHFTATYTMCIERILFFQYASVLHFVFPSNSLYGFTKSYIADEHAYFAYVQGY